MLFERFRKTVFGGVVLLLSLGALMASEPTEQPQEEGLVVLQKWFKETIGKEYSIESLKALTKLSLNLKDLTKLPPEIGHLTNLERLYLQGNQLTELPPEIGNLTNLNTLDLWHNQLTELPPEIGNLTNLNRLILLKNSLTELPPEIGNLTNLNTLDLRHNQLTELSPEIGTLENLQHLEIDPQVIKGLSNLLKLTKDNFQRFRVGNKFFKGEKKIEDYIASRQG